MGSYDPLAPESLPFNISDSLEDGFGFRFEEK